MPRLFTAASSHTLDFGSALASAFPLSMAVWFNPTTSIATGTLIGIGATTGSQSYVAMGVSAGAKPFLEIAPNTTPVTLLHGTSVTNGRYGHICAVIGSATDKSLYFNGGTPVVDATSSTFPTVNRTNIAGCFISTRTSFANGIIAHAAIWNVALTSDEVRLLASGYSPLQIRPNNLISYIPIWGKSPETDMAGRTWTLNGSSTVSTNLPPMSQMSNNYQQLSVGNGMSVGDKIR